MRYHPFQKHPTDRMIATDEYEEVLEWINNETHCAEQDAIIPDDLPFLQWFECETKSRLLAAGFKKEKLDDKKELNKIIGILKFQGMISPNCGRIPLQNSFPPGTFTISEDELTFWVDIQIEAAIQTLKSIEIIKRLLVKDDVVDKNALEVYLRTVQLMISLTRTGNVAKYARIAMEETENSRKTRELKKLIMGCIIDNIFKNNPHRPKTLGEVWNKVNKYGCIRLESNNKIYVATTREHAKGQSAVFINGYIQKPEKDPNGKDLVSDGLKPFKYAKRSLQRFIDEYKKNPPEVTQ